MPHFVTFDSFTANTNLNKSEADGFMKLDDIRGEFTTGGGGDSFNSWRDVRDHNHGKVAPALPNVAISCEDGDVRLGQFGDEVDVLTKGGQEGEKLASNKWDPAPECSIGESCTPTCDTGFADEALVQQLNATVPYELQAGVGISANARGKTTGTIAAYNVMGRAVSNENHCTGDCFDEGPNKQENTLQPANVWTNGSATSIRDGITGSGVHGGLANGAVHPDTPMDTHPNDNLLGHPGSAADALTNDPLYKMQPAHIANNRAGFETGLPIEGIGLRSDNRFVIEPVNLLQDLDSSSVDVVNKLIDNAMPVGDFI